MDEAARRLAAPFQAAVRSPSARLAALLSLLVWRCSMAAAGLTPRYLRCEYLVNPLGIDVTEPRLSWIVEVADPANERAQKQTAYRVLVASSGDALAADRGDLWDSGKVDSSETAHVVYAGKALGSRARCQSSTCLVAAALRRLPSCRSSVRKTRRRA